MEDFPALEPVPVQALSMEERMANMEKKAKETDEKFVRQGQLLLPFCERELVILGAEILKWSVKKQGVEDGHGLHLFDSDVKSEVFVSLCFFKVFMLCFFIFYFFVLFLTIYVLPCSARVPCILREVGTSS